MQKNNFPSSKQAPAPLEHSGRIAASSTSAMDPNHFPSRLHEMLLEIDNNTDGTAKIVSWQPHGKCFLIKNKEAFMAKVLPRWFCRLKFTTFERQLHKHGFRKLSRKGPDQGAYYHPRFVRDTPEMARSIQHTNIKGKRGRKPKAKLTEPDFYSKDGVSTVSSEAKGASPSHARGSMLAESKMGESKMSESKVGEPRLPESLFQAQLQRDPQARLGQSLQRDLRWQTAERMQALGVQQAQSFLSPLVGQHADTLASLSGPVSHQAQHMYQQLPLPGQTSAAFHAEAPPPAPQLTRQPSDYSIGAGSIFGALGDSPPDDLVATPFASLEQSAAGVSASQQLQMQPMLPLQMPVDEHQERLNDLLYRNQQQQMNLQLQQQQLEQQRLELQVRGQPNFDLSGGQFYQQHQQFPHSPPSANLLLREQQQQQLQQYQSSLQQVMSSNLQHQQQQSQTGQSQQQPPDQQYPYNNSRMP